MVLSLKPCSLQAVIQKYSLLTTAKTDTCEYGSQEVFLFTWTEDTDTLQLQKLGEKLAVLPYKRCKSKSSVDLMSLRRHAATSVQLSLPCIVCEGSSALPLGDR